MRQHCAWCRRFRQTSLANALCHDRDIGRLRRHPARHAGPDAKTSSATVADLIVMLTGERPDVTRLDTARELTAAGGGARRPPLPTGDRRCLACEGPRAVPASRSQGQDGTSITTRDDSVLPADARRVSVDAMTTMQALAVLVNSTDQHPPNEAPTGLGWAPLAARLGSGPLLLGLANGVLRARIDRGSADEAALEYAERSLAQRGLAALIRAQDQTARRSTAAGASSSMDQLTEEERHRFPISPCSRRTPKFDLGSGRFVAAHRRAPASARRRLSHPARAALPADRLTSAGNDSVCMTCFAT